MCQSAIDFSLEQGLCDQEVIDPTPQKQLSFSYFEFHLIQLIRQKTLNTNDFCEVWTSNLLIIIIIPITLNS